MKINYATATITIHGAQFMSKLFLATIYFCGFGNGRGTTRKVCKPHCLNRNLFIKKATIIVCANNLRTELISIENKRNLTTNLLQSTKRVNFALRGRSIEKNKAELCMFAFKHLSSCYMRRSKYYYGRLWRHHIGMVRDRGSK